MLLVSLISLGLLLLGCSSAQKTETTTTTISTTTTTTTTTSTTTTTINYFPLNTGIIRQYSGTDYTDGVGITVRISTEEVIGDVVVPGTSITASGVSNEAYFWDTNTANAYIRTSTIDCYRKTASALFSYASDQSYNEMKLLQYPIVQGETWLGGQAFGSVPGTIEVVATDETVTVPAGTYEHTLKIQVQLAGPIAIYPGLNVDGIIIMDFAPNVGIIMQANWIAFSGMFVGSTSSTVELASITGVIP